MISLFVYAGDCFSLFRIFGNKPEKKITQKPLQPSSHDSGHAVGDAMMNQGNVKYIFCPTLCILRNKRDHINFYSPFVYRKWPCTGWRR